MWVPALEAALAGMRPWRLQLVPTLPLVLLRRLANLLRVLRLARTAVSGWWDTMATATQTATAMKTRQAATTTPEAPGACLEETRAAVVAAVMVAAMAAVVMVAVCKEAASARVRRGPACAPRLSSPRTQPTTPRPPAPRPSCPHSDPRCGPRPTDRPTDRPAGLARPRTPRGARHRCGALRPLARPARWGCAGAVGAAAQAAAEAAAALASVVMAAFLSVEDCSGGRAWCALSPRRP